MLSAGLVGSAAIGARQTFGLFVQPLSLVERFSLATVAFTVAVHNLDWASYKLSLAPPPNVVAPMVAAGAILFSGARS